MERQSKWLSEAVGRIFAKRRNELGFTQQAIADKLRIQRTSLSNIEAGKQVLLLDVFYDLCKVLDLSPSRVINEVSAAEHPLEEIEKVVRQVDK